MRKKFLRRFTKRYKRLGKNRKKKQIWRRPKGIHNKMRERNKGYPTRPEIGMRKAKKFRGKIQGMNPIIVRNIKELKKIKNKEIVVVGKMGKKKREEILKEAEKMNLKIFKQGKDKKQVWKEKEK